MNEASDSSDRFFVLAYSPYLKGYPPDSVFIGRNIRCDPDYSWLRFKRDGEYEILSLRTSGDKNEKYAIKSCGQNVMGVLSIIDKGGYRTTFKDNPELLEMVFLTQEEAVEFCMKGLQPNKWYLDAVKKREDKLRELRMQYMK